MKVKDDNQDDNLERERKIFRRRADPDISDKERLRLIFTEFELLDKDIDIKSEETKCKSNWYNIINSLIMLSILTFQAVIIGLESASDCVNIPVITLAALTFVAKGSDELFSLGNQGMFYKQGTIVLRRLKRDVREVIYKFHKLILDEALFVIGKLRDEFDEIDLGLYKISVSGHTRYNGSSFSIQPNPAHESSIPVGLRYTPPQMGTPTPPPPSVPRAGVPPPPPGTPPHVHIHIDSSNSSPKIGKKISPTIEYEEMLV